MQNIQDNIQPPLASESVELLYPVLSIDYSDNYGPPGPSPNSDMAPPSDVHSDDTGSSLSESAYEVLGDSTILTSDDEDNDDTTDSLISVGIHTPADVSSLAGTDDGEDDASTDSQVGLGESTSDVAQGSSEPEEVTRSDVTIRDGATPSSTEIDLEVSPHPFDGEVILGTRTLQTFSMEESLRFKNLRINGPPTPLAVTVIMEMSQRSLEFEGPFHVLYVGDRSAKGQIIAKLASSLAVPIMAGARSSTSQHGSSRFNIVQFSPSSEKIQPEIELIESMGMEIVVDECNSANSTRVDGAPDNLSLLINSTFQCHSRSSPGGYVYEGPDSWKMPHLAVFFVSDKDDAFDRQTRQCAQACMSRHAVPTIMISQSALYERPAEDFNVHPRSLHACLVFKNQGHNHLQVVKRLPIDLGTFLKVNSRQLHQHLVLVTEFSARGGRDSLNTREDKRLAGIPYTRTSPEDVEKSSQRATAGTDVRRLFRRRAGQEWRALALLIGLVLCVLVGTSSTLLYHKFGTSYQGSVGSFVDSPRTASLTGARLTSPPMAPTAGGPGSNAENRLPMDEPNTKGLAVLDSKELASILTQPSIMVLNQSEDFKTQMVGDCHIILRLPKKLAGLRKTPVLAVKVVRRGQGIDAEVSKLFEGVYALRFQREDAWGIMDISVSTTSKPFLEQKFQVDCGTPWLKIREWRKAALDISHQVQNNFRRAQGGLEDSFAWVNTGIQTVLGQAGQRRAQLGNLGAGHWQIPLLHDLGLKARRLSDEMEAQRRAMLKGLAAQANAASCLMTRHRNEFNQARNNLHQVWKQMDDLRTVASKTLTVARARKQAGRVWSRMSSKISSKRETRANRRAAKSTSRKDCSHGRRSCRKSQRR